MEQTSSQVGPYRLYERIGGGGFASVYVARDTRTNEMIAVKVLHMHLAQDAQFIARFRREAEALQKMPPHPNIVRLREFGQQGGTYYLAMEYLEGKDLSQILAERKRLPVEDALSIATQIAQALDMANRHGLVHRDIKPGNVKITPQGIVKVMDFGIARATEGTKLTQTGAFMGTPDYMAPEIWEGKPADIRSDIYALGAILYEMMTGTSPFHSDTPAATMRRHLMEQVRPVRATRADVPANLDAVITKMIAKQPEARYQTPTDVLAALHDKPSGKAAQMVSSKAALQKPRPAHPMRPRLSRVWIVGVVIVALLLMALVAIVSLAVRTPSGSSVAEVAVAVATAPSPASATQIVIIVTASPVPPTDTPTATSTPRATPTPHAGEERTVGGAPMVYVSPGEFRMGSESGSADEKPAHNVYLDAFWIDKVEVTNAQYQGCVDAGSCSAPQEKKSYTQSLYYGNSSFDNFPVIYVTWNDAGMFCAWKGKRLPTEAEWEKAARGTDGRTYPWGNIWDGTKANSCDKNCPQFWKDNTVDDKYADLAPVGSYPSGSSPYGVLDMVGNAWEWVADWYDGAYYDRSPSENPKGPVQGQYRVMRGGSWYNYNPKDGLRASLRFLYAPDTGLFYTSFRCAQ